jgi:hypothetical protein
VGKRSRSARFLLGLNHNIWGAWMKTLVLGGCDVEQLV